MQSLLKEFAGYTKAVFGGTMVQRISCCLSRLFPENRETAYALIHFRAPDVDIGIPQNIRDEITAYHPTEEI